VSKEGDGRRRRKRRKQASFYVEKPVISRDVRFVIGFEVWWGLVRRVA
jgi:hypothetical protein